MLEKNIRNIAEFLSLWKDEQGTQKWTILEVLLMLLWIINWHQNGWEIEKIYLMGCPPRARIWTGLGSSRSALGRPALHTEIKLVPALISE